MTADNENEPRGRTRFSVEDARERAQQAFRKSEFILSRAWGLLREPKKEWEQIKAEQTTIPNILIGYVAPLAFFPPLAQQVIAWTPFRGMLAAPVELLAGFATTETALADVAVQAVWTVLLAFAVAALWRRGLARYGAFGA